MKTTNELTQAETKQSIPSPEDRVRAIREREQKASKGPWVKISTSTERDPGCGISSQIGDGTSYRVANIDIDDLELDEQNKNADFIAHARADIPYLLSLVEELTGQAVSASQQPRCPEHKIEMVQKVDRKVSFWGCPNDGCGLFISVELLNQVAQFFPAAPTELSLLTKRKDYHAEYVEAVEAVEKAQGALRSILAESGIDWIMGGKIRDIAERALTPEPATKAEVKK